MTSNCGCSELSSEKGISPWQLKETTLISFEGPGFNRLGLQIIIRIELRGGFQARKIFKYDFEIMIDPKGTLNGATLGFGFENPNP